MDWFKDRADDVSALSSGAWTALAAWIAVLVAVAALAFAYRQVKRARKLDADLVRPLIAVYLEPNAADWHLIELVVKNYGRLPAYAVRFDFVNAPTVAKYEEYDDGYLSIVPLSLPAELPVLAPSQEWRVVWDSALDRKQLGNSIESRFDGAVCYLDSPEETVKRRKRKQHEYETPVVLDWSTLHPAERLELLTTHDMARQERQKLELLRNILTYYNNVTKETREDVIRGEIDKVKVAVARSHERLLEQNGEHGAQRVFEPPPEFRDQDPDEDPDPITTLINGRHRQNML